MNKVQLTIGKVYLYIVGAFFILMAVDCFADVGCPECSNFWERLLCFGISIIPGVVVILVNYFLRRREKVLGTVLIVLSVFAFVFFKFYRDFYEKIPTFVVIVVLPLLIGCYFIYYRSKNE